VKTDISDRSNKLPKLFFSSRYLVETHPRTDNGYVKRFRKVSKYECCLQLARTTGHVFITFTVEIKLTKTEEFIC